MKYALVLEKNSELCNKTANIVSSIGYLVTPVFSSKKALHAAHMIQFDLILTCTAVNQDDRRSLTGELKRCSPDALVVLLADPEPQSQACYMTDGVSAVLQRPLAIDELRKIVDTGMASQEQLLAPCRPDAERRRRAID
jgi:CheY-like chemotaxis protein